MLAVYTAAEIAAAELGGLPCLAPVSNRDGSPMFRPPRPLFAEGQVRHVGEPVAMVVAETPAAAMDAAELIAVDFATLPAVVDTARAAAHGAPTIWNETTGNVAFHWHLGNVAATDRAFDRAAHVTALDLVNNRADHLPAVAFARNETPCAANALGIKGCGEAGAIGAPPAVINAIVDVLAVYGFDNIDMPATSERIWRAIQAATVGSAPK